MAKYENKTIAEFQAGQDVEGFFVLKSAAIKTTTTGSPYLTMKISDTTGSIDAKIWEYDGELHTHVGEIIKARGNVGEYKGVNQLTINQIRLASTRDTYDVSVVVPSAPIDVKQTIDEIEDILVQYIKDSDYFKIVEAVYAKYKETFCIAPAALTVHHAFRNGLLMHTCNMLKIAVQTAAIYKVNTSLLIAGTFCHDIAKTKEMVLAQTGLANEYSTQGALLGHLVMGAIEIGAVAKDLGYAEDNEKVMLLQHMLLSHHGKPEWGAAVVPKTIEAVLLHHIDSMDAEMEQVTEMLEKTDAGHMTDKTAFHPAVYSHS